ncbi:hypothetical protein [Dactylosporangium sp. CA-139066]|uniref:hypothetical protein n=1 Tax=Dactylosporangium sp. CA-139066 TaxID=3239930 RepID=UPI003D8B6C96
MRRLPVRWIVAAVAAAVIAAVLLAGRHSGSAEHASGGSQAAPTSAAAAESGDEESGDDGSADVSDQPADITAGPIEAREAAVDLLVKILNTQGKSPEQWRAGFRPLVTDELAAELADADPAKVPVGRVGDQIAVAPAGDELVTVTIPIVSASGQTLVATAKVTLTGAGHRWLGSQLDLEQA